MTRITFNNGVVLDLVLYEHAVDADVRAQIDYEVSQGWHTGVDSSNTYTWEWINGD